MIKFFKKIRFNLMSHPSDYRGAARAGNKTSPNDSVWRAGKYLKYAIGEIILVVVGILIALQINNWNEKRKVRDTEVIYLNNIKRDLNLSINEINSFVNRRNSLIRSAIIVLEHFDGKPVEDWNAFNKHIVDIYTWQSFYIIDNTYQELKNSGNFAIISIDSIKNELLNLGLLYNKLKTSESHWRHDAEQTLYPGSYEKQDISSMSRNYFFQQSNGKMGVFGNLSEETFGGIFSDQKQKNGFALAINNFEIMNGMFLQMNNKCQEIILLIDNELTN